MEIKSIIELNKSKSEFINGKNYMNVIENFFTSPCLQLFNKEAK